MNEKQQKQIANVVYRRLLKSYPDWLLYRELEKFLPSTLAKGLSFGIKLLMDEGVLDKKNGKYRLIKTLKQ